MANYLEGVSATPTNQAIGISGGTPRSSSNIFNTDNALTQIASGNLGSSNILVNLGFNAAINQALGPEGSGTANSAIAIANGAQNALAFLGLGSGSKPKALHTEYAGGKAQSNQKPYNAGNDIVFYLMRADASSAQSMDGSEGSRSVAEDQNPSLGGNVGASGPAYAQTAGDFLGSGLQTPLSQLGVQHALNQAFGKTTQYGTNQTMAGFMSDIGELTGFSVLPGSPSQDAVNRSVSRSAIDNAVGAGQAATVNVAREFGPNAVYNAAGQEYFQTITHTAFNDPSPAGWGTSEFIEGALANAPTADFTHAMSAEFPTVFSTDSMVSSISSGLFGVSSPSMTSAMGRSSSGSSGLTVQSASEIQRSDTAGKIPKSWHFITPPQDVSWSKEGNINEFATYGTNTPYISYGSTSLRKLSLSNALIEGFSDNKTVEKNLVSLEAMMNMVIQQSYTAPYCWKAFAGPKSYGTFVITNISTQEVMRDYAGNATRATVNVELQEVAPFQVYSGRDIASKSSYQQAQAQQEATQQAAQQEALGESAAGQPAGTPAAQQDASVSAAQTQ